MSRKKYFAVIKGRRKGIFTNHDTAKKQIQHFKNSVWKGFTTLSQAREYVEGYYDARTATGGQKAPFMVPTMTAGQSMTSCCPQCSSSRDQDRLDALRVHVDQSIVFQSPKSPQDTDAVQDANVVVAYTDGSKLDARDGQAARSGFGVYFPRLGDHIDMCIFGRVPGATQDNNVAELYAIDQAIRQAKSIDGGAKPLHIYTDSLVSIQAIQSAPVGKTESALHSLAWLVTKSMDEWACRPKLFLIKRKMSGGNCVADRLAREGASLDHFYLKGCNVRFERV